MIQDYKDKSSLGLGVGLGLHMLARYLTSKEEKLLVLLGLVCWVAGISCWVWGCMNYALGKGYSKSLGWFGLLHIIGLLVLLCLRDRHKKAWRY